MKKNLIVLFLLFCGASFAQTRDQVECWLATNGLAGTAFVVQELPDHTINIACTNPAVAANANWPTAAQVTEWRKLNTPPTEFPNGIALPALTNGAPTYAVGATPEGDIVTWVDHASPRDAQAAQSNKLAALNKKKADKQTAKDGVNGQLQVRIENLERLIGVRP